MRYPVPPWETSGRWPHVSRWEWRHWDWWLRGAGKSDAEVERYRVEREQLTLRAWPRDRRGQTVKGHPGTVLYAPTPKGCRLHLSHAPNVLFGGAAGVAKSHTLRWDAHLRALNVEGFRALLLRRQYVELKDTHLDRARMEAESFGARLVEDELRYPRGSVVRFGHCQHPGDELRYLSTEYDAIYPDELATFERSQILEIMSRARTTKEGVQALVRSGSNPGGAHTLWCIDYYMTKTVDREENPYYVPEEWEYIPGLLYDNPYLMDPDGSYSSYERRLGALNPMRRKQMLEGDWSAISGQFFAEFSLNKHVVVRPVPPGSKCYVGLDYGFNDPGVAIWNFMLPDGRMYARYEYKFVQTNLDQVAKQIRAINEETLPRLMGWSEPVKPQMVVVDPDLDAKKGGETGVETLRRYKVKAIPGDNNRHLGWLRFRHWLAGAPDGEPWFQMHPDCRYGARSVPTLVSDKNDAEDVDTQGDDHWADAQRMVFMARPSPDGKQPGSTKHEKNTVGWWIHRAKQERRRDARTA